MFLVAILKSTSQILAVSSVCLSSDSALCDAQEIFNSFRHQESQSNTFFLFNLNCVVQVMQEEI